MPSLQQGNEKNSVDIYLKDLQTEVVSTKITSPHSILYTVILLLIHSLYDDEYLSSLEGCQIGWQPCRNSRRMDTVLVIFDLAVLAKGFY